MSKLRRSAKGQPCCLNIANVCSYATETTVLAHLRDIGGGHGMALKPSDLAAVYACADCHAMQGGSVPATDDWKENRHWYEKRALFRTHQIMFGDKAP